MLGYRFCLKQLGLAAWPLSGEPGPGNGPDERERARQARALLLEIPGEGDGAIPTHLELALRHEGVDLAAMAAVCAAMDPRPLADWINSRPSSKYARKAGFLYEWLTGRQLPVDATRIAGSYEPVLDEDVYFIGPVSNSPRWHVRNNLPGTPQWCPTIHRRTPAGLGVGTLDVTAQMGRARALPRRLLSQALAAALLSEVQSSYILAGETASAEQETAVARLLRTAGEVPVAERLSPMRLIQLQGALFAGAASHAAYGLRREDRFAGSAGSQGFQRIEYPFPPARALESLLDGVAAGGALLGEGAVPPTVLAAVMSFGLGFIHPLSGGNGRIHRYLVHAALAATRALKSGAVIPLSEVMLAHREEYREVQRVYCTPLRAAAEALGGVPFLLEPGNVFSFPGYERVAPLYRYPVLTAQVAYLERVLLEGIDRGLIEEAHRLQGQAHERARLATRLHLPLARLDLLVRMVRRHGMLPEGLRARLRGPGDEAALRKLAAGAGTAQARERRRAPAAPGDGPQDPAQQRRAPELAPPRTLDHK
jgi:hypothetical protein